MERLGRISADFYDKDRAKFRARTHEEVLKEADRLQADVIFQYHNKKEKGVYFFGKLDPKLAIALRDFRVKRFKR